jgi:uncharacterized protein
MMALLARAESLIARLEGMLPEAPPCTDWTAQAFRWIKTGGRGRLVSIQRHHHMAWLMLLGIDGQKRVLDRNTRQFLAGRSANNVLLTGARGTGKSSLVKALLDRHAAKGLRLIEVDRQDLVDLPQIADMVCGRPERFILFCDDLSFEADEPGYKALKTALDGSLSAAAENLLIYATSNRRHLMPEFMVENLETRHLGAEVHPGETTEEKLALSERFGLWLSFYPFDQDTYLMVVRAWVKALGGRKSMAMEREALQWALARGGRSGRVAWQFARDWAGRYPA